MLSNEEIFSMFMNEVFDNVPIDILGNVVQRIITRVVTENIILPPWALDLYEVMIKKLGFAIPEEPEVAVSFRDDEGHQYFQNQEASHDNNDLYLNSQPSTSGLNNNNHVSTTTNLKRGRENDVEDNTIGIEEIDRIVNDRYDAMFTPKRKCYSVITEQSGGQKEVGSPEVGAPVNLQYIIVEKECERIVKRFNLTSRRIMMMIKPIENEDPIQWLGSVINELISYVARGCGNKDYIGLVFENQEFPDKPVGISFRRLNQLNVEVILEILGKILQSNATFFTNDKMSLCADIVSPPIGYGFAKASKKCVTFNEFCARKNSIYVIKNYNNKCLAMALVAAIEYHENGFNYLMMKKKFSDKVGMKDLNRLATELCIKARVDLTEGGRYEHIAQFQAHLTEYNIVVYSSRDGRHVYFLGHETSDKPRLNLIMENYHYNVIISLTGAFSVSYFCEMCRKGFWNLGAHGNCPYACVHCHKKPPCILNEEGFINCSSCHRRFKSHECLKHHLKIKLCQKLQKCPHCECTVWVKKTRQHKCGFKHCKICGCEKPTRHLCHMKKVSLNESKQKEISEEFLLVFYDFETRQDTQYSRDSFKHTPNLCVSQQVCAKCINNYDMKEACETCGQREFIFTENPVIDFLEHLTQMTMRDLKITAIAHNMKGFDGCFILKELFNDFPRWTPDIIRNGCKIMSIKSKNIRFIDSLNFIQLPLSGFSKAFNVSTVKGYFPHYFNTLENQDYVGPIPDRHFYGCDTMKPGARENFIKWHDEQLQSGHIFNMKSEIVTYCVADVNLLREGCLKFRECFLEISKVDPLLECITIASACNLVFRRNFLKEDSIGIIPKNGYRYSDAQSEDAIKWLMWLSHRHNVDIQHSGNGREVRLPENILVDGYCADTRTVYEFYGCFWHGCRKCFLNQTGKLSDKQETLFIRHENTLQKEERIRRHGYNLITIWECKFHTQLQHDSAMSEFYNTVNINKESRLCPRDAFFGGRTNAARLYHNCAEGERIKYFDVCSLYPYINKYMKYPVGHPKKIHVGNEECIKVDLNTIDGLVKCTVLPPTDLYHPVLPYKCNNKLMFPLCRTCAELMNQRDVCTHDPDKRQFNGTYVADELRKAVEKGYVIVVIMEIWEYDTVVYDRNTKTGGLFSDYVNMFLKIKQECSGWPSWCKTEEDKDRFIQEYEHREGIRLQKDKVNKNAGMRLVSKTMLNSFWGKFGQKENAYQTKIIGEPYKLFELLSNSGVVVSDITVINPEVLLVTWQNVDEDVKPLHTVNVVLAAYTTAGARLELYKYLDNLGRRVLYYDTDSVIFTHREGDWEPPTGDYLGDMTDELSEYGEGSYIAEFVSGGPKNYAYRYRDANNKQWKTVCKVKGITLHYKNAEEINFEQIKNMVLQLYENDNGEVDDDGDVTNFITLHDSVILRTKIYDVLTKRTSKRYSINYTKRVRLLDGTFDTVPYGYRS